MVVGVVGGGVVVVVGGGVGVGGWVVVVVGGVGAWVVVVVVVVGVGARVVVVVGGARVVVVVVEGSDDSVAVNGAMVGVDDPTSVAEVEGSGSSGVVLVSTGRPRGPGTDGGVAFGPVLPLGAAFGGASRLDSSARICTVGLTCTVMVDASVSPTEGAVDGSTPSDGVGVADCGGVSIPGDGASTARRPVPTMVSTVVRSFVDASRSGSDASAESADDVVAHLPIAPAETPRSATLAMITMACRNHEDPGCSPFVVGSEADTAVVRSL